MDDVVRFCTYNSKFQNDPRFILVRTAGDTQAVNLKAELIGLRFRPLRSRFVPRSG